MEPRASKIHMSTSHQGCPKFPHGRGGEKDRAGSVLDAEDNPSADAAIYGCELERDLACLPASRVGCECE